MQIGQKNVFYSRCFRITKKFVRHVAEISPAAGSEFSVLKTDNATDNFTKVVQRISVKISIDPNQPELSRLRPGMPVITSVDTASAGTGTGTC